MEVEGLVRGVLAGDRRAVARAISLVEDGRSELELAAATDTTVLLLAPGLGDAVQMAKAGILEVADVFVVNKADRDGAGDVSRELRQMLHLGPKRDRDPPVLSVAAATGDASAVGGAVEGHDAWAGTSGGAD